MSNARPTLVATHRDVTGKKVAHLRRQGRLPAVLFGHGLTSEPVSVDAHEFEQLHRTAGNTTLVDVRVDGGKAQPVLIHGVQREPIKRRPLHVDLFVVRMTEELTVEVPVVITGTAPAVEQLGGTLNHIDHLRVRALPDHLPQHLELAVDSLAEFDSVIHVREIAIPGDVTLLTDPAEIAARVLPPRIEEAPVAEVTETAGEGAPAAAEGETAEPAAAETSG